MYSLHQWGSDIMAEPGEVAKQAINTARAAQLIALVKENQLVTAFVLFFLWQTGAFLSAATYVQGGVC